ncbi:hypothetical protein C8N30_2352 [Sulfitobacter guttiformis]|uniref:Phage integrase family protein n=1 Tax=Sulfitobacter guttiformis TaxID=74349 RepID=A0A420DU92_9RHOB|nr:hypothetical protein C8N30_2352 [Sulfitobacter guttiformis]
MADRGFYHGNTKPTGHLRTSPRFEQGAHCQPETSTEAQTCLAIRIRLELAENHHDLALFKMVIDSKLRWWDLVRIKERVSVLQSKTQKPVRFEISEGPRASVAKWMEDPLIVGSEFLRPRRFHAYPHVTIYQYAWIVRCGGQSSLCTKPFLK